MTLIKNLSLRKLIFILPKHCIMWICFASFLIMRGNFRFGFNVLGGIYWNAANLSKTLSKRQKIQTTRVISDELLFERVMKKQTMFKKIKQFFLA